jgi:hypothetical protein
MAILLLGPVSYALFKRGTHGCTERIKYNARHMLVSLLFYIVRHPIPCILLFSVGKQIVHLWVHPNTAQC